VNQLLYLLLCTLRPISTNNLQLKFDISDEAVAYLDPLIKYLS
jgi:hypothetical protein